jgi:LysR family glycine cleavage system transcriptional activator
VSHQIRRLEEYLGVSLFHRVARGVRPTRAGRVYYPSLREAFDLLAEATELVLAPLSQGPLTLQVYSTFAVRWLIPRLPAFQRAHPGVIVRLHTSQSDVNFEHEDVDVCVMMGEPQQPGVHYDYLFSSQIFPVASPALKSGARPLNNPADLEHHTLIQVYPSRKDWFQWLEHVGVEGLDPDGGLQMDSYDLALNTAAQGLGVALGMHPFVNRELQNGTLQELFPDTRIEARGHWHLACREALEDDERVIVFRQWLLDEVRKDSFVTGSMSYAGPI